jgi:hypothetical protein
VDELKERATQIRKIGTRIRKKTFAGAKIVAQNLSAGIHFRLLFSNAFMPRSRRPRGKDGARSADFFQSRGFCAVLKNKVQIFACRFFSPFLISRRWHGARESSV